MTLNKTFNKTFNKTSPMKSGLKGHVMTALNKTQKIIFNRRLLETLSPFQGRGLNKRIRGDFMLIFLLIII